MSQRDALATRVLALLASETIPPELRDELLGDLAAWQAEQIPSYANLVARRGPSAALPTDVFRYTRVASYPADEDRKVFRTSGTTLGARGEHPLRDLRFYDTAARRHAQTMLFPDVSRMKLVSLVPTEAEAPDSSLAYMVARFGEWFGAGETTYVWREGKLDHALLATTLRALEAGQAPVALLGTSFAFVFAEDSLSPHFRLPPGSRVMQTGGFKGKSREIEPDALRSQISSRYGVPEDHIVAEYGMTELGSQAYESTLALPGPRRLLFPPWVRVQLVDPETLAPVEPGSPGIVRVDDLANVDSVCMLQTADLARSVEDGFVLLGRAPGAVARGCSLAVEEALGR